jgi:hypothetical protein
MEFGVIFNHRLNNYSECSLTHPCFLPFLQLILVPALRRLQISPSGFIYTLWDFCKNVKLSKTKRLPIEILKFVEKLISYTYHL